MCVPFVGTAIVALGRIGPDAAKSIPAISGCLRVKDGLVRQAAAESLGKLGPLAETATTAIRELLNDKDEDVRFAAAKVLKKIQGEN